MSSREAYYKNRPKDLRSHQWHFGGQGRIVMFCPLCGWRFESYEYFLKHTMRYHNWDYEVEDAPVVLPEGYRPPPSDYQMELVDVWHQIQEAKRSRDQS